MSTGKWTPGPWDWTIEDASMAILHQKNNTFESIMAVSPCKSCMIHANEWEWGRCLVPNEADARLIASAPEMLEALKELEASIPKYDRTGVFGHEWNKIKKLIAKAEGRGNHV